MSIVWLYILKCSDNLHYTGITSSLITRLKQHSLGYTSFTRRHPPLSVLLLRPFVNRKHAAREERRAKNRGALRYIALYPQFNVSIEISAGWARDIRHIL